MTRDNIYNQILTVAREISPAVDEMITADGIDALKNKSYFVDLYINSIDYIEIVTCASEILDVDIPIDIFANTNNVWEVVDVFYNAVTSKA